MNPDQLFEALADAMAPRLEKRGFVRAAPAAAAGSAKTSSQRSSKTYDDATCAKFLDPNHLGDNVLGRARIFFNELNTDGEVTSPDLVNLLGLKGARSIPANLTIALKKSAWRLGLQQPWEGDETPDGLTVWRDRDGIAAQMLNAIEAERVRRGHP